MLFLARSPTLIQVTRQEQGIAALLYQAGKAAHRPWLVLTYLMPLEPPTCYWETACTQDIEVLLDHLKQRPKAQVADFLYMRPPTLNDNWTRDRIAWVDRGTHNGAPIHVYCLNPQGENCLDQPSVAPDEVHSRKRVLLVDWFRHFNF